MKKVKSILAGTFLVLALCMTTACGEDTTDNAADESEIMKEDENAADDSVMEEGNIDSNTEKDNAVEDQDMQKDKTNDNDGDVEEPDPENTDEETMNGTDENNKDDDGTVSGELGNSVKDIGDGVGNAIEDVGDAVDNAADGR